MHCSNCGNIVRRGDIYCSKCKAKLVWKEKLSATKEKYRKLSIAALVTGLLSFTGFFPLDNLIPYVSYNMPSIDEFLIWSLMISCYMICLPIPAILSLS